MFSLTGLSEESSARRLPLLHHDRADDLIDSRKAAFIEKDVERSRAIHQQMLGVDVHMGDKAHLERHASTSSDNLRSAIFGGLDGIATVFATIAGCVGANLSPVQTLIVGLGNLFANAVSMGFGEYVSAKAESDFTDAERAREEWEVENCPEEEKKEMVEIYQHRYGIEKDDAQTMINIAFKYKEFFISHMMAEELGLLITGDGSSPFRRGVVMFGSFIVCGFVPLISFLGWSLLHEGSGGAFVVTTIASAITFFVLGVLKSQFVGQKPVASGVVMLANGTFAGLVAFGVGSFLQTYAGNSQLTG